MDGRLAIECNVQALKRILLTLVAMAGIARGPEVQAEGEPRGTLPRHLHRAVLRLLRPAESAARRLIIALARGMSAPPPRMPIVKPLRRKRHFMPMMPPEPKIPRPLRHLALSLLDPLPRITRRRRVRQIAIPHICAPGRVERAHIPVRLPPSPHDPLDATRLGLRLDALARALDDLPRQAQRVARWRARQAGGKIRRLSPLRIGSPPGARRKPDHEVYEVLDHAHRLAWWALRHPDTS